MCVVAGSEPSREGVDILPSRGVGRGDGFIAVLSRVYQENLVKITVLAGRGVCERMNPRGGVIPNQKSLIAIGRIGRSFHIFRPYYEQVSIGDELTYSILRGFSHDASACTPASSLAEIIQSSNKNFLPRVIGWNEKGDIQRHPPQVPKKSLDFLLSTCPGT
jgi:hypothetical protein